MSKSTYVGAILIFTLLAGFLYAITCHVESLNETNAQRRVERQSYSEAGHNKHIIVTSPRHYDDRTQWWLTELEIDGKKFLAIQADGNASPTLYPIQ